MSIVTGKRIWAVLIAGRLRPNNAGLGSAACLRRWHQDGFPPRRRHERRGGSPGEEGRGAQRGRCAQAAHHGGGRFVPREAAGGSRASRRKGQERALLLGRYRHRGLAADAGQLERAHSQLWRRRMGRRRASLRRSRSAARCRPSSTPIWATRRGPPTPDSRGTRTARSRFSPTARSTPRRLRDFSVRAMVEQAVKTKALVSLYYGKAPKYTYYDGHSQGGRQGMKIAQEYPELYDGYMIAPASAEHREVRHDMHCIRRSS